MPTTYITYEQLTRDVERLDARLPRNLAGIIAVPRSGLLPATMLAMRRNLPLLSFGGDMSRDFDVINLAKGEREVQWQEGPYVVVDDSVYRGNAMKKAKEQIASDGSMKDLSIICAAVYKHPDSPDGRDVDVWAREIDGPRYFAWNIFHHPDAAKFMLDLDGVVCHDPPIYDDGVGGAYEKWLPYATPRHVPTVAIGAICTNRLQIWREQTAEWLKRHGVTVDSVYFAPYDTPGERSMGPTFGVRKGQVYAMSECTLFIESDDAQARIIAEVSQKPALALDTGVVYQ